MKAASAVNERDGQTAEGIERLRASREAQVKVEETHAHRIGFEWARDSADYRELRIVASARRPSNVSDAWATGSADAILRRLDDVSLPQHFADDIADGVLSDESFFDHFFDGALEYWDQVEEAVEAE